MNTVATHSRTPRVTGRAIIAWVVLALVTTALLGPLRHSAPGPQPFDGTGLRLLIDQLGPSAPLLWLIRLGASAAAVVHLALLTLAVAARAIGAVSAVRVLDRISPVAIRRLLTPLTVVSLTGTMSLAMTSAAAATPAPPPLAVMVVAAPIVTSAPATIEVDSTVTAVPAPSPASAASTSATSTTTPRIGGTVIVARGDSLWSITEEALHSHLGRRPTDRETSQYWRALIDANRDRLRDRDDPGLIFTGQQFTLP